MNCPDCGARMVWVEDTKSWYCPKCDAVVNTGNT
jgi:ribosomal protein L37AE/L43A